jgi:DNA-binding transcriptional ArsR family regulator
LDITQANASYHLRQLLAAGLVVVAEERSIRGGVAKIYRHPHEVASPVRRPGPGADRLFAQALAAELVRRADLRKAQGRGTSTDAELWVEPEIWAEVVEAMTRASQRLHAAARPAGTPGTIRTSTTTSLFEMESQR